MVSGPERLRQGRAVTPKPGALLPLKRPAGNLPCKGLPRPMGAHAAARSECAAAKALHATWYRQLHGTFTKHACCTTGQHWQACHKDEMADMHAIHQYDHDSSIPHPAVAGGTCRPATTAVPFQVAMNAIAQPGGRESRAAVASAVHAPGAVMCGKHKAAGTEALLATAHARAQLRP